jgi:hypothetical protein
MTASTAGPVPPEGLLEPFAGKLAWAVLRGRGRSNAPALPDRRLLVTCRKNHG